MEDPQQKQPELAIVGTPAPRIGIVRQLFDINAFYTGPGRGWRLWGSQVLLFVAGTVLGSIFWRLVHDDSAGDRSFLERMLTNVYIWACLLTTGFYALRDWRARRQNPKTD